MVFIFLLYNNLFGILLPGAFTTNVVAAAPVIYCKNVLNSTKAVGQIG